MLRILFLGVKPESVLQRALSANGMTVQIHRRLPEGTRERWDLIVFHPPRHNPLQALAALRRRNPHSWIACVIDRKFLKEADFQNRLLCSRDKDDVWFEPGWSHGFWFLLQRTLEHQRLQREVKSLKEETESLKAHYRDLSASSDKLIAQLEKDVGLATNIQRTLLPKISPEIPGISVAVKYIPAAGLGGDYYDIFEFGDRKRFGVLMADSRTHGMAALLLSVLLKVRLDQVKDRFPDSHSFVEFINREIQSVAPKEISSLSLLYGILDRSSLSFQFTVAGSLRPLLWREGEPLALSVAAAPPLGDLVQYDFRENRLQLQPGDLFLLHTDGLDAPLAQIPHGTSSFDRLVQILHRRKPQPHDSLELQNELMALVDQYIEKKPLEDDLTLVHFTIDERVLYMAKSK